MSKHKTMEYFTGVSGEVQKPIEALHKKHKTKGDLGVTCELLTVAVGPDFAGKGIASALSEIVVSNAIKKGFKVVYSEATGVGSTKALLKIGGAEVRNVIKYAEWTHGKGCCSKGTQPLTNVEAPHTEISLIVFEKEKKGEDDTPDGEEVLEIPEVENGQSINELIREVNAVVGEWTEIYQPVTDARGATKDACDMKGKKTATVKV